MKTIFNRILKNLKNKRRKNIFSVLLPFTIGAGAPAFWSLLFTPIFTKILDAEAYGIIGFYQSVLDFIWVFAVLGINTFVLREYYIIDECDKHKLFQDIFSFLFLWNLLLCLTLFPILIHIVKYFTKDIPTTPYVGVVLIINFFKIFYILPVIIFRLRVMSVAFMGYSLISGFLLNLGSLLFLKEFGPFAWAKMAGMIPVYIIITLLCLFYLFRKGRSKFQTGILRRALKFSYPLVIVNICLYFSGTFDRILVQYFTSKSDLGIYTVGNSLANIFKLATIGLYQFGEPLFFRDYAKPEFTKILCNNNLELMLSILSFAGIIVALSPELLVSIFVKNDELKDSVYIIPFLLSSILVRAGLAYVMVVFVCFGHTKVYAIVAIITAVLVLGIELALFPYIKYYAPPTATVCSLSIIFFSSLYFLKRKYNTTLHYFKLSALLLLPSLGIILSSRLFSFSPFSKNLMLTFIATFIGFNIWTLLSQRKTRFVF